jgi:glycosyltransferase involved in cell wall biosynthesis
MNYPKISIVTPSYNQGQYIEETILSVLEQNYPNLEYIIIDGGSTDNSVEIIKKYEKHLAYWVSEKDGGMYEAIQKGFDKSTGEIMAWLNSDDMYHRKSLFTVAKVFQDLPEVEWIQGQPTYYNEQGIISGVREIKHWSRFNLYLKEFQEWIQQESCFWKRKLWKKAGGYIDVRLKYAGDFELWTRFFRYSPIYVCNFPLSGFRGRSENQLSKNYYHLYLEEANKIIDKEQINIQDKKKIQNIISCKKYLRIANRLRLNIWSLKEKLYKLYEYTPIIQFSNEKFYLQEIKKLNEI